MLLADLDAQNTAQKFKADPCPSWWYYMSKHGLSTPNPSPLLNL